MPLFASTPATETRWRERCRAVTAKRAKQRRNGERRARAREQPGPTARAAAVRRAAHDEQPPLEQTPLEPDVAGAPQHASSDVDEFDRALVRRRGAASRRRPTRPAMRRARLEERRRDRDRMRRPVAARAYGRRPGRIDGGPRGRRARRRRSWQRRGARRCAAEIARSVRAPAGPQLQRVQWPRRRTSSRDGRRPRLRRDRGAYIAADFVARKSSNLSSKKVFLDRRFAGTRQHITRVTRTRSSTNLEHRVVSLGSSGAVSNVVVPTESVSEMKDIRR